MLYMNQRPIMNLFNSLQCLILHTNHIATTYQWTESAEKVIFISFLMKKMIDAWEMI